MSTNNQSTQYGELVSTRRYSTFAGTDISVYAAISSRYISDFQKNIDTTLVHIGNLQTISYSLYRDKQPVSACGRVETTGFTRGSLTVAGTMVFTVLNERPLKELSQYALQDTNGVSVFDLRMDQLPPIDIFITFANEYGQKARISIFGVEFMNEGQVMSIHDLLTENTVNYLGSYLIPMRDTTSLEGYQLDELDNKYVNYSGSLLPVGEFINATNSLASLRNSL